MKHARRGYTLVELAVVLAIVAVVSTVIIPAFIDLDSPPERQTAAELLSLLEDSRKVAIDSNVNVTVYFEPVTGEYRVDSTGVDGTGTVWEGTLDMLVMEALTTEATRLRYYFRPTGSAIGDTVRVEGRDSSVILWVDPWNGVAHAGF